MTHTAYIALGGNIGDRAAYIHDALDHMASYATVVETSHLYETDPMLVTDQPLFLNAVCQTSTELTPSELLRAVKHTEKTLGRTKSIRYGPRVIDLDILFFDDTVVEEPDLIIPHIGIPERDFVLAPLLDLNATLRHPRLDVTVRQLWQQLAMPRPPRVMPVAERIWRWSQRPGIMGILNITPDSFSGDGLNAAQDPVAAALTQAANFVDAGADVLDIGGYSTRPGHVDISAAEEIERVVPVIDALRQAYDLPLSVDTFRVEVAQAALNAGASWINDVSGLLLKCQDENAAQDGAEGARVSSAPGQPASQGMAALSARRRVPLVLMQNQAPLSAIPVRACPDNSPAPSLPLPSNDIVADVARDLATATELARRDGVPRWHRIIDPGIGFGKSPAQHAELINRLDELQALDYPLLFGCSRKGFLGKMAGGAAVEDRLPATIAANVMALERGANILRVHDVRENVQAARVFSAILHGYTDPEVPSLFRS